MKKLLALLALSFPIFAESPKNPSNPLNFYTVSVPVTTTRASLFTLINTYMAANRVADYQNYWNTVSVLQITAAKANAATVLVGDSTVAAGAAPTRQAGAELAAGEGYYDNLAASRDGSEINLKNIYAVSDTGTNYLLLRVRK